jgi:hypothetical protein
MPFELSLAWGIHGVLAIMLLAMALALSRRSYRGTLAFRFSQTVRLLLASEAIAAAAERRIQHRTVAMTVGGLLGLAVSAIVLLLDPATASAATIWLVTLPAVLTGLCAGAAFVALRESLFPRHPDAVRLARAVDVAFRDYVSPRRLRTPVALLLVAIGVYIAGLALGLTGLIDGTAFLRSVALPALATALLVLIGGGLLARQVLRRPQPAGSELELAWDDAFRSDTLRALWMFGSIIAWLSVSATGLGILQGIDARAGTTWSTGLGSQLFNWGFLVILFCFSFGAAQSYFRFRLWPELAIEGAETSARAETSANPEPTGHAAEVDAR